MGSQSQAQLSTGMHRLTAVSHSPTCTLRGGQGSLAGCSPWGRKEEDMAERLNNNKPQLPVRAGMPRPSSQIHRVQRGAIQGDTRTLSTISTENKHKYSETLRAIKSNFMSIEFNNKILGLIFLCMS